MAIKYKKLPQTIPNGHKIYQHFPFKFPPKYDRFGDIWSESKPSGNPNLAASCCPYVSTE
jgi:hypothetical protein